MSLARVSNLGRAMLFGAALCLLTAAPSAAGTILIPPGGGSYQVQAYEPIGQSFTAEDATVSAGLYFTVMNPHFANSDPIQYSLYAGTGVGGPLLNSSSFMVPDGFSGFHMVDFSATPLTVGNVYTLAAHVVGGSPYWGVTIPLGDPYAGGDGIFAGNVVVGQDVSLQVIPTAAPEPVSVVLLGIGLAGAAIRRRIHTSRAR